MKVAILGFGNVASATVECLMANQELIASKTRTPIEIVSVATRTPARAHGRVPKGCRLSDDCWASVDDPETDVVVELTGNVPVGRELVLRALANRKHVVTANKALLARHGEELMRRADEVKRCVLFEGAVAVSIPIIKTLRESAAANHVRSITGILNGTSNYVLSQMSEHDADFATALAEAQRRGYAEADPSLDISGEDAAHKLALLASLAFGVPINLEAIDFEGIQGIDGLDIGFAKRLGYRIKSIAQARKDSDGLVAGVHPTLVPMTSMLSQVSNSMNGIAVQGDLMGSAFLYGSGAGGRQTASAVLADLIDLANRYDFDSTGGAHNMGFRPGYGDAKDSRHRRDRFGACYMRLRVEDKAGVLAKISQVLADAGISVNELLQDRGQEGETNLVVVTHDIGSRQLIEALPSLQAAAGLGHPVVVYHVLGEH
jgi:homoserine dehydrogenase